LRLPQPGGAGLYLYPTGTEWPSFTPGHWVPFLSPLQGSEARGWGWVWFCGWRSVGQFVLVSGTRTHFWCPWPGFNFLMFDNFFLFHEGHRLWVEDGSVVCSAIPDWLESRKTHNHKLHSHMRLPQPGAPGSRIYISLEEGGPVIPPGTRFPLCRDAKVEVMLRLTVSMSWCRTPSVTHDQMFVTVWRLLTSLWGSLFDERSGLSFASQSLQYLVGSVVVKALCYKP
jgi:hypothetical protein